jgi:hypothetical protein
MLAEAPETAACSVTGNGVLRIPRRLREWYLTPAAGDAACLTQAAGTTLHIWVWSDRDNVRLDVPLAGFRAERPFERSVHRWGVNVNRYIDHPGLDAEDGTVTAGVARFEGVVGE